MVCDDGRYVHCFIQAVPLLGSSYLMGIHLIKFICKISTRSPESLLGTGLGQFSCTNIGRMN